MEAGKIYHVVGRNMNKFPFITLQAHSLSFVSLFYSTVGHSLAFFFFFFVLRKAFLDPVQTSL